MCLSDGMFHEERSARHVTDESRNTHARDLDTLNREKVFVYYLG